MKREVALKWVAALRSGEFKQTTGNLRRSFVGSTVIRHCCLGVLTEIAVREGVAFYEEEWFGAYLPESVMKWAGLEHWDPKFGGDWATQHNDLHKKTFEEIADLIEKEFCE